MTRHQPCELAEAFEQKNVDQGKKVIRIFSGNNLHKINYDKYCDYQGKSVVLMCASLNCLDLVQMIVETATDESLKAIDQFGCNIANYLVGMKIVSNNQNPLSSEKSLFSTQKLKILKILADRKVPLGNVNNRLGTCPLYSAIVDDDELIAEYLINNVYTEQMLHRISIITPRYSFLQIAVSFNFVAVVKLLLKKHVDFKYRNADGHTALDIANFRTFTECSAILETLEV